VKREAAKEQQIEKMLMTDRHDVVVLGQYQRRIKI
jgi:hypothetical protein